LDEVFAILLVLGIVLAVVTVVGHGIWVLLSRVFRGRPPSQARQHPGSVERSRPERVGGVAALDSLRRQLDSFEFQDALDEEMRKRLRAVIRAEEASLAVRRAAAEDVILTSDARAPVASGMAAETVDSGPGAARHVEFQETQLAEEEPAAAPVSLVERARKFSASRESAAKELAAETAAAAGVSKPPELSVPVSRLFAAFMEENNIRWGELVGGLLIVGCSVALVISLWSQIAGRPLLQFVLFNGVTAALFGVGVYTDRRWKIHTTSRGLLIIATLLVPLNFLALAAFTQQSPPTDLWSIAGEIVSLAVFAVLVLLAGKILAPDDAVPLTVGVIAPCLMLILVRRFARPAMPLVGLYGLAMPTVVVYLASTCMGIRRRWSAAAGVLNEIEASRTLSLLGLLSAAAIVPTGLLLHFVPPARATLHWLSPLVSLYGLPALLTGMLFWRRMTDKAFSALQTAGIGVGALGAMLICAAVVLAWPDPATLLPAALATAAAMLGAAIWFGIPAAHVPAAIACATTTVVAFYVLRGDVGWTLDQSAPLRNALLSATTGYLLLPLAALFAGIAWWLRGLRRDESSFMYGLVTAVTAAASLALALWFGFGRGGDPQNITWLLLIYALGALATGVMLGRVDAARGGAAILFAATVQCVVFRHGPTWQLEQPWITALLAHATLMAVGCSAAATTVARWLRVTSAMWAARFAEVIRALVWSALVTSSAAAIWLVAIMYASPPFALTIHLAWLSAVWLMLGVLKASPAIFSASQIALVFAIPFGVAAAVASRGWYMAARYPWLDPWFLELVGIVLAAYCLLSCVARWFVARVRARREESVIASTAPTWMDAVTRLMESPWPSVDSVVEAALVVLVVALATYAVVPGVAQELSPLEAAGDRAPPLVTKFEIPGIEHARAAGPLAWLLLGAVAATLAFGLWRRGDRWRVAGIVFVAMAICPLLAVHWESDFAVASALRWTTACFFAIATIGTWMIGEKARDTFVRDCCVAFVMLVYVAMGAYVLQAVLMQPDASTGMHAAWPWVLLWGLMAGVVALILPTLGADENGARLARFHIAALPARPGASWQVHARNVLLFLAAAPVAILLTFAVAHTLDRHPIVGPEPGSWFYRIGIDVSYGVPLAIVALAFIGHAIRGRSSGFAFAAGLLFNAVATIAVLWRLARGTAAIDETAWIEVAQFNAIVAAIVGLVWSMAIAWRRRQLDEDALRSDDHLARWPLLLVTQAALAAVLCATFLAPAVASLAFEMRPSNWVTAADGAFGWAAVALTTVVIMGMTWRRGASLLGVALFAAAIVSLTALTASRLDHWLAYRVLMLGGSLVAWLLPLVPKAFNRWIARSASDEGPLRWSALAVRCFAVAAVLLAWSSVWNDPAGPWWAIAALLVISGRNVWIAWWERRRGFMWIAAALLNIAITIWWFESGYRLTGTPAGNGADLEWLWFNVLALAMMGLVSVWVERRRILTAGQEPPRRLGLSLHRFAAWIIVVALVLGTTAGLLSDWLGAPLAVSFPLIWAAWLASAALALVCLWDPAARWPVACLYCYGLTAVGIYLDRLNFRTPMFPWALANALSAYSLGTSALWAGRGWLRVVAERSGAPMCTYAKPQAAATWEEAGHGWLVPANLLLGGFVLCLAVYIELSVADFTQRMVTAYAVGAQAFAIALLARGRVRMPLQYLALVWGALFAVAFGWAFLPPDFVEPWLHRLVMTVAALVVVVVLYGFGLVKLLRRENEWTRAASRLMPPLAILTVGLVLVVLAAEVAAFVQDENVQITVAARIVIGAALAGLTVAALAAALLPGRDPLGLSERGRTLYVYAAEAFGALLFLHIRVTMPWLFRGWFMQFWPLVVMGIAYLGVGLGEVFLRRRQRVLSEPLQTTGVLLPLLPVLGFWSVGSQVHYSLLLLSIGVLYASMSVLRRSSLYGILAAVAANGSLWYLLHDTGGLAFLDHPQLWLIPPALSALIAGYINRERLTPQQSAALRYASAIVIYVSSTADIFINGVANAPWLPAVLAGLSIVGVLAGIWLRVRAFLYLGTAFMLVAIMTIIWHAAVHQQRTYILWAAGILTGALIIALFGLFEKRRDDVLRVVEELKHWHA